MKKLNDFLKSFNNDEILVMNTFDEPSNNSGFKDTLINDFGSSKNKNWKYRSAFVLVSKKDDKNNAGLIYEK